MATAPSPRRILVTGATGFVGRALVSHLVAGGRSVRASVRSPGAALAPGIDVISVGDIGADTDWRAAVSEVDAVVHLAARVHVTSQDARNGDAPFRAVNVEGAVALARAALEARVHRLVLVSSTTVYGDLSTGAPFDEASPPAPTTPYAHSKLEGEQAVAGVLAGSATDLVVLRPPLIYGPGAKGNFARLVRLVRRGIPLPLASVRNRRSLLFVGNLVDAIVRSTDHPAAAGRTFVISDGEDLSTPELIRRIAAVLDRPARLWPCPPSLLRAAGMISGRSAEVSRLIDNMAVDSSRIRTELGWHPPFGLYEGLRRSLASARGDSGPGG